MKTALPNRLPATDAPLLSMQPKSRLQAVRRVLLPTAVRKIAAMLNDSDTHVPQWRHRLEALDRLNEWSLSCASIWELQQRILDSSQLANVLEVERAFRVMTHYADDGRLDLSPIGYVPLSIAVQVIRWWDRHMREFGSVPTIEAENAGGRGSCRGEGQRGTRPPWVSPPDEGAKPDGVRECATDTAQAAASAAGASP